MAEVRRVSVVEAQALLDEGFTYVDVRTEAEFAAGHPTGARHVPYLVPTSAGLAPNPGFDDAVRAALPEGGRLIVGCASGRRSVPAAERLAALGYRDVVELRPGFEGVRDAFGRLVEKGWRDSGLPVTAGTPESPR